MKGRRPKGQTREKVREGCVQRKGRTGETEKRRAVKSERVLSPDVVQDYTRASEQHRRGGAGLRSVQRRQACWRDSHGPGHEQETGCVAESALRARVHGCRHGRGKRGVGVAQKTGQKTKAGNGVLLGCLDVPEVGERSDARPGHAREKTRASLGAGA